MSDAAYLWAKIRSWHLSPTSLPAGTPEGTVPTLCGRLASGAVAREPEPPAGEKTCEACFRVREARPA